MRCGLRTIEDPELYSRDYRLYVVKSYVVGYSRTLASRYESHSEATRSFAHKANDQAQAKNGMHGTMFFVHHPKPIFLQSNISSVFTYTSQILSPPITLIASSPRNNENAPSATLPLDALLISPASHSPTSSCAIPVYSNMPAEIESSTPIARMVDVPERLNDLRMAMPIAIPTGVMSA
jgi:hypothetical protein